MRIVLAISLIVLLSLAQQASAMAPVRVLSLDGGGIKGIIELAMLVDMEEKLGKPISQIFDFIAGTSTGGIIALGLVAPGYDGKPLYSAKEVLKVYLNYSATVFSASDSHRLKTLGGLVGPKYENTGLHYLADYFLADCRMSEALIPTLITAYHLEGESGVAFYSEEARLFADKECLMREVALATSAAPTYFPTVDVQFSWGKLEHLADGALYKPNPSMLAYLAAQERYPGRDIELFSLGSGKTKVEKPCNQLRFGGLVHWAAPIVQHLQSSETESDNEALHRLLNQTNKKRYFRLNVHLSTDHKSMDDVSPANILALLKAGKEALNNPLYVQMLERLKARF